MALNISDLSGGGYFVPEALQSDRIVAGQTGLLLSIPEVSGKVYKITRLTCTGNSTQGGISLIIDGVTVFDEQAVMDQTPTSADMLATGDSFGIASTYSNSTAAAAARIIKEAYCTSFSVIKNAGNTAQSIDYAYQVGSFK